MCIKRQAKRPTSLRAPTCLRLRLYLCHVYLLPPTFFLSRLIKWSSWLLLQCRVLWCVLRNKNYRVRFDLMCDSVAHWWLVIDVLHSCLIAGLQWHHWTIVLSQTSCICYMEQSWHCKNWHSQWNINLTRMVNNLVVDVMLWLGSESWQYMSGYWTTLNAEVFCHSVNPNPNSVGV